MKRRLMKTTAFLAGAVLVLTGCGGTDSGADPESPDDTPAEGDAAEGSGDDALTLWLMGGDTPDELRDYLKDTFKEETGADLVIEE